MWKDGAAPYVGVRTTSIAIILYDVERESFLEQMGKSYGSRPSCYVDKATRKDVTD